MLDNTLVWFVSD